MKKINFVHSVSERHERHIIYWFLATVACMSMLGVGIITRIPFQLIDYYRTYQYHAQLGRQVAAFDTISAQYRQQIEEKELLEKQLQKLDALIHQKENPNQILGLLAQLSTQSRVGLHALTISNKNISLSGSCHTVQEALSFLDSLKKEDFIQQAHMHSLQHTKDNKGIITFIIQLTIH